MQNSCSKDQGERVMVHEWPQSMSTQELREGMLVEETYLSNFPAAFNGIKGVSTVTIFSCRSICPGFQIFGKLSSLMNLYSRVKMLPVHTNLGELVELAPGSLVNQ